MTPALLTLARELRGLPGFPLHAPSPWPDSLDAAIRGARGELWRSSVAPTTHASGEETIAVEWVLDLTDDATAGVLFGALPIAVRVVTRTEPSAVRVMWLDESEEPRQHSTPWVDTLGEACARLLVARGRCG